MNDEKYNNISTATTTTVKAGGGYFQRLVVNTTTASTITIYDSLTATGPKIATFAASTPVASYDFGHRFGIGLTVVTAGASDLTVVYQ